MASRLEHVVFLSMSLALILILLVTVTVLAAPSGLLDSSSAPAASIATLQQKRSAQKPRDEGFVIPRTLDRHGQSTEQDQDPGRDREQEQKQEQEQELQKVDVMAVGGADARLKTWPLLVGLDVEEAKEKILAEHPTLLVQIVPEGNVVTMDFNLGRVRIFKNEQQKVARAPRLG